MMSSKSQRDMVEGYCDGILDNREALPKGHNHSPAYEHGWNNGRDDRIKTPRDSAKLLRARADLILNNQL